MLGVPRRKKSREEIAREKAEQYAVEQRHKELNDAFDTFKYHPVDKLSYIEEKFLHKIDLEITHRNPNISMEVTNDISGNYIMQFSNGEFNVEKSCDDKERCFKKLKSFMETLKAIPVAKSSSVS